MFMKMKTARSTTMTMMRTLRYVSGSAEEAANELK
jgi:hypothetical protein